MLSEDFCWGPTEGSFGLAIPIGNDSLPINRDESILSRFNDRTIAFLAVFQNLLSPFTLGDILDRTDVSDDLSTIRKESLRARVHPARVSAWRQHAELTGELTSRAHGVGPLRSYF